VKELPRIMALGVLFALLASLAGLYASFYANVASGAAIVLTLTLFFVVAFLLSAVRRGRASR
ncbi:MAG: metal ABC transporter permease, partial [Chloroflexota bacterium]